MIAAIKCALMAGIGCMLATSFACRHQPVAASHPTDTPPPMQRLSMQPDQVNTAGWDKAWTNLLNVAEQSFAPSLPKLLGVEVELVVGNPGETEDELTLTIMDANNKELAVVTERVRSENSEHPVFLMPADGIELLPGQSYRLRLTGGATFGWKYVVGGYEHGEATFNGKPLLQDARSPFCSGLSGQGKVTLLSNPFRKTLF